jgi:hypothetical protein
MNGSNETAHWIKARARYAAALKTLQNATDNHDFLVADLLQGMKHKLVMVHKDRKVVTQVNGIAGVRPIYDSYGDLINAEIIVLGEPVFDFPQPWYVTGYESKADYERVTRKDRPRRK